MTQPTGGDLVASILKHLDVTRVFAIASIHNLPILGAIHRLGYTKVVDMRHEQGAVHAADAYARVTGQLGVAIVSTGPGTANALGGLFEAAFASSRVLLITGQVPTKYLQAPRDYIHEAPRQTEMLHTVCRCVRCPESTESLLESLSEVTADILSGRLQPGAVVYPIDIQGLPVGAEVLNDIETTIRRGLDARPRMDTPDLPIERAAALLANADRPLIWAGGGVASAGGLALLTVFAERHRIPVVTSREGRGAIPEDHPLALGCFPQVEPFRAAIEESDCVLAVGTQFQMYSTDSWSLQLPDDLIHLDIDDSVVGRVYLASGGNRAMKPSGRKAGPASRTRSPHPPVSGEPAGVRPARRPVRRPPLRSARRSRRPLRLPGPFASLTRSGVIARRRRPGRLRQRRRGRRACGLRRWSGEPDPS